MWGMMERVISDGLFMPLHLSSLFLSALVALIDLFFPWSSCPLTDPCLISSCQLCSIWDVPMQWANLLLNLFSPLQFSVPFSREFSLGLSNLGSPFQLYTVCMYVISILPVYYLAVYLVSTLWWLPDNTHNLLTK